MFPPTSKRVQMKTDPEINQQIREKTMCRISEYKEYTADELFERIHELNREWDTERFLETYAAMVFIYSAIMGVFGCKKWLFVSAGAGFFLLNHALQGWCPPLPIIRKMGVRTESEIFEEKAAVKEILHSKTMQKDV